MNRLQAYNAIFLFMDEFWEARKADFDDDLPVILGLMSVRLEDGFPWADSVRYEWFKRIPDTDNISAEEAFAIMERYWSDYLALGEPEAKDISRMVTTVEASKDIFWQQWFEIVEHVSS